MALNRKWLPDTIRPVRLRHLQLRCCTSSLQPSQHAAMRPMFATDARLGFQKLIEPVCAMQHLGKSENEAVQNMAYFN